MSHSPARGSRPMHKVIFDTDPGVDDALALLYLARHPDIDLLGVTTVFGNAPLSMTFRNARVLARAFGATAPVHAGAAEALVPVAEDFPWHIHGNNGLGNLPVGEPADPPTSTAVAFLIDTIRAHPGEVRILAVGRMTNLALALAEAPEIAGLVRDVVLMGGAFGTHGNITPAAEANIFGDPLAADHVFRAQWPVTAIPLNVTRRTVMTRQALADLCRTGDDAMRMVGALSQDYIGFYESNGEAGMLVHDCTAGVFLTDPDLFDLQGGSVRVCDHGPFRGQTLQRPDGIGFPPSDWDGRRSQQVAMDGDGAAILDRIAKVCGNA
ncbi:nucleoside hydrolase [Falsirhodobacter sp. 20TX0035]|uniref:nucleoside hydrolase n=1 Tax=Falsirhodobacter sp. 20TX0035 TaxID=3022019 RepID=UPI00232CA3E1|nr:nucleoside hydrolase [Falsirhodobacter sp. 20TX0035]MDB6454766.1 nucleoside hydrolase [Falsirhodobacter sp. 20TX0035]